MCRELAANREELREDLALAGGLADTEPGPAETAHASTVRSAATAAGLNPAGLANEAEASRVRLDLLELVLDAMEAGTPSPADGRAIAWHYTTDSVPDTEAASHCGTTPAAWQLRRSRAVDCLKGPPFRPARRARGAHVPRHRRRRRAGR
ncbi:hypothetical protein ACWD4L_31880 [Streptomyces sp. NPDC002596]